MVELEQPLNDLCCIGSIEGQGSEQEAPRLQGRRAHRNAARSPESHSTDPHNPICRYHDVTAYRVLAWQIAGRKTTALTGNEPAEHVSSGWTHAILCALNPKGCMDRISMRWRRLGRILPPCQAWDGNSRKLGNHEVSCSITVVKVTPWGVLDRCPEGNGMPGKAEP